MIRLCSTYGLHLDSDVLAVSHAGNGRPTFAIASALCRSAEGSFRSPCPEADS
jgi:hypothetical protein